MSNYEEDYERRYEKPYIANKVIGFSGIDPALSPKEIARVFRDTVNEGQIVFDGGEIT